MSRNSLRISTSKSILAPNYFSFASSTMKEKIKSFFDKTQNRVSSSPAYAKFSKFRHKVAEHIKNAL